MKKGRQEKILELISRQNIETQDDLISHLRSEGYTVTQATVSRDIRAVHSCHLNEIEVSYVS